VGQTCILHVGTEKTGSTSIQRFLALNRDTLHRAGAYVPASLAPHAEGGFLNHIALSVVSRPDLGELDDLDRAVGLASVDAKAAFAAAARARLADELAGLAARPRLVLLSNEHIHSRLCTPERLRHLRRFLARFFRKVVVVVYLRSQHEMARSLVNTALRQGRSVRNILPDFSGDRTLDPDLPVEKSYFDLHGLLQRLQQVFGRSSLRVRLFPEGRPAEELIRDYCRVCGLDEGGWRLPPRENASFSPSASLLFREVNAVLASQASGGPAITDHLSEYLNAQHPGRGLVASPAEIGRFMEVFRPGNEMVRRSWFPHAPALFAATGERQGAPRALEVETAVEMLLGFISWRDQNLIYR
jgi:hypothetical protein